MKNDFYILKFSGKFGRKVFKALLQCDTGKSGIKGKNVQLHDAEDGTWACETTIDGKYAAKSCSVITLLSAAS